ncbi:tyrosine-type recombinase/integrase [Caldibacillus thermoamylovorans]|uniref:tyrosine-type recombinase/integrase n=1 Tax=Caldibacillus thermoamylovorans TaxID=35841 RepID=UPI00203A8202|nr:tyrosine-type recombinase/integrase [Caldibacillus thermoamylovorans]MCM3053683.1 tyrosine-type recombinase/integrase [Caldibacillus thermoamylovorans]
MNFVQPIRDPKVIKGIKEYLKARSLRNYLFFCMGIYSGLRVSDLLTLRVGMVKGTHVNIIESKTKKAKKFLIHPSIKEDLDYYIAGKDDDEYLFQSRQKKTKSKIKGQPIDRSTAYRMLKEAGEHFGLTEIGTHTMRKTYGYHLYMQNPSNLALLMKMFNHSNETITLMYIGVTQEMMDEQTKRLSF